ncbi:hypothetical protein VTJ49DRAFT_4693 [Mycothermus thermophilus]|uniref:Uncharacterized protein n=1 Tax=Humicola insolens TaxID=85995 RepID=A0ABR3V4U9_HUMIN
MLPYTLVYTGGLEVAELDSLYEPGSRPLGIRAVTSRMSADRQVMCALKVLGVPAHKPAVDAELSGLVKLATAHLREKGSSNGWKADIGEFLPEFQSHHRLGVKLGEWVFKCLVASIFVARIRHQRSWERRGLVEEPGKLSSLAQQVDAFNKVWCEFAQALSENDWARITGAEKEKSDGSTDKERRVTWLLVDLPPVVRHTDGENSTMVVNAEVSSV